YVEDKYNRVVTNYATSYNGSYNRGFDREIEYWAYTGSGNIHSTSADLLRWMRYYYDSPAGWEEAFSMMLTLDDFNNGETNDYAFGVRIDEYKGEKRISHSGSIGGYRAFACTFPEHETEIAVLTNFSSSDVSGKVNRVSEIILEIPEEESMPVQMEAAEIDPEKIEKFIGTYDLENSDTRMLEIMIANDSLFCRYTGGRKIYLQTASDSVLFNNDRNIKISLLTTSPPSLKIFSGSQVNSAEKADKFIAGRKYLEHVAGTYFSPELETQYRFYVRDDKLFGYHTRHGEFPVESLKEDIFISGSGFISKIVIVRERNKISGMKVSNSRVRDLWLERR
ncbi:MAG: serine hydrolase, partial [Bacteroidota bacterium]